MLKVILIDDEWSTLRLLPKAIDWAALGLEIRGAASSGEEGLDLLRRVAPDIVIVDIKMPGMDGLEFARLARRGGSPARIILLSAYAEFRFAQAAIQLRISDYLLKPLDEDRLRAVLNRIIQELEAERGQAPGAVGRVF